MTNRISQFWGTVDALLASTTPEAQQEGTRLAACPFTAQYPLEVFLDRKYLAAVVGVSVRQMRRHAAEHQAHEPVRLQLEAEIARREAFVQWLATDDRSQVYMNLYPGVEFPVPTPTQSVGDDDDQPRW